MTTREVQYSVFLYFMYYIYSCLNGYNIKVNKQKFDPRNGVVKFDDIKFS